MLLHFHSHEKTLPETMSTFANRKDQDEIQHNVAFHLGIHSLLK